MLKIGSYNELVVQREVEFGLYLNPKEHEVLLPSKYVPKKIRIGDTIRVFVYTDSENRVIATTLEPKGIVGQFVYLEVKDVTQIGTFMDWGLEKDLLVPANEQVGKMRLGEKHVVKVCLDKVSNRIFATSRITSNCDTELSDLVNGQKVNLLIYDITKIGIMAVINNRYAGMLYKSETYQELSKGDSIMGYIVKIRDDGKVDLSLKKPGYGSVKKSSKVIIDALTKAGGFLPYNDKSSPDVIKHNFSMSKQEFKRTIGGLYKTGKINIMDNGIRFKKKD